MPRGVGYTPIPKGYLPDTASHLLSARIRREGPESMATRGEMSGGNPRRGQSVTELPTLLQIPLCVMAGPPEEGDLSLHRPALVDPAHNLDRREDPKGARPKVGLRFSTQTIAEEAQGSSGRDGFLPTPDRATEDIRSACMEGTCAH